MKIMTNVKIECNTFILINTLTYGNKNSRNICKKKHLNICTLYR